MDLARFASHGWGPCNGTALLHSKCILDSLPILQSPQTYELTWKFTRLTPMLCFAGYSTNNTPHVKVLEHSIWNKHAWKKLEKLVYTVNFECVCNACYGQSHFYAFFLLFFCLPSKSVKDELYHHFTWVDLWQLSGLLTLLLPQCSSGPSALLASNPLLSFLFKVKALLKHFGEPQLLKSHKHKLVIWQRILFLHNWRNQPFSISTYGCSICSRACLQCTWLQ